jgi:hypothetical protein
MYIFKRWEGWINQQISPSLDALRPIRASKKSGVFLHALVTTPFMPPLDKETLYAGGFSHWSITFQLLSTSVLVHKNTLAS